MSLLSHHVARDLLMISQKEPWVPAHHHPTQPYSHFTDSSAEGGLLKADACSLCWGPRSKGWAALSWGYGTSCRQVDAHFLPSQWQQEFLSPHLPTQLVLPGKGIMGPCPTSRVSPSIALPWPTAQPPHSRLYSAARDLCKCSLSQVFLLLGTQQWLPLAFNTEFCLCLAQPALPCVTAGAQQPARPWSTSRPLPFAVL